MKELIRQNARRFRKPPLGPIGSLIKLRRAVCARPDFDCARAAEYAVSKCLSDWWCDNHEDGRTLQALLREARLPAVNTIVSAFRDRAYDDLVHMREGKDHVRLVDCFEYAEPGVINVLVDVLGIEGLALGAREAR